MRILVVEADQQLQSNLCTVLSNHHFIVDGTTDSKVAWGLLNSCIYDLVILDAMAPTFDGLSLCRLLRDVGSPVLILLLLASFNLSDRIQGLESGADGCLANPPDTEQTNYSGYIEIRMMPYG